MNKQQNSRLIYLIAVFLLSSLIITLMVGVLGAYSTTDDLKEATDSIVLVPDWVGESNKADSYYGEAVRSAGDVNGDGYEDAIVGAVNYNAPGYTQSGRAYLYYGTADGLNEIPNRIFEPPTLDNYGFFGGKATTAGDVNNDTYSDIMISIVNYDQTGTDEGAVYVWYGSETGPATNHDWMARGVNTHAHMGWDIGTAGDVNGDSYDDIIIGVYQYVG